jgi:hypothetical protein
MRLMRAWGIGGWRNDVSDQNELERSAQPGRSRTYTRTACPYQLSGEVATQLKLIVLPS